MVPLPSMTGRVKTLNSCYGTASTFKIIRVYLSCRFMDNSIQSVGAFKVQHRKHTPSNTQSPLAMTPWCAFNNHPYQSLACETAINTECR